jgi:hypothetical protein
MAERERRRSKSRSKARSRPLRLTWLKDTVQEPSYSARRDPRGLLCSTNSDSPAPIEGISFDLSPGRIMDPVEPTR